MSVCFLCSKHCCSWRGSNPRPWAYKTHALTTRPQERIRSGPKLPVALNLEASQWRHQLLSCTRMQLPGTCRCKTVLYTGSVFEYIRAWRFQPLAQGQSRMMMNVCWCRQHEHGDDCHEALAGCVLLPFPRLFVPLRHRPPGGICGSSSLPSACGMAPLGRTPPLPQRSPPVLPSSAKQASYSFAGASPATGLLVQTSPLLAAQSLIFCTVMCSNLRGRVFDPPPPRAWIAFRHSIVVRTHGPHP